MSNHGPRLAAARLACAMRALGQPAVDREALVDLMLRFSQMVVTLQDSIAEIDRNPVIVNRSGCTIVDALVVPSRPQNADR